MSDQHISPWRATMPRPELGVTAFRDVEADVVVVGAGVTGMTTALLLQRAGQQVVVVDAEELGRSVTTGSTVKVTFGHGTTYSTIAEAHGLDAARHYAGANVAGLREVLALADELDIDCALERGLPHVVYAERDEERAQVEAEAAVATSLGLPVALTRDVPLPFPVAAALRFDDQAQFHPGRYLAGLAEAFVRERGVLLERARVVDVDEHRDHCTVETTSGRLSAGHVVVATHYPVLDRGAQFGHLTARRSYGVAGVLPSGTAAGMTINVGSPRHSTRTARLDGEDLLVVVGEGHKVGHESDTSQRCDALRAWAGDRFGVTDFRYHWSAEETTSVDHLPFVGHIAPGSSRVLTATGFDGWGMTNGTASAILLRDLVLGRDNPWEETFDARRAEMRVPGAEFVKHNVHVGQMWLKGRVGGAAAGSVDDLESDSAAVLEVDGKQTAAYRDERGELHAVSAVCTHLGCTVAWNDGEKSWDCPCHGSRFSCDGQVLHGPATRRLEQR